MAPDSICLYCGEMHCQNTYHLERWSTAKGEEEILVETYAYKQDSDIYRYGWCSLNSLEASDCKPNPSPAVRSGNLEDILLTYIFVFF